MGERSIVGRLGVGWKKTARQLLGPKMITHTIATNAFARTAAIGAGTLLEILGLFAFHRHTS
jgi:hypothetical protein